MSTISADKAVTATVEKGQIILPEGTNWPDGTVVCINPVNKDEPKTFRDLLKKYEGVVDDMPPDLAENHDKYFRGRLLE